MDNEQVETRLFDKEEIHHNCTVQILTNTVTGETSVGWWRNDKQPEEDRHGKPLAGQRPNE